MTTTTTTTEEPTMTTTLYPTTSSSVEILPTENPGVGEHLTGSVCSADLIGTGSTDDGAAAAVRCCNDVGGQVSCESMDSASQCLPIAATFADAQRNCSALSMRLCTMRELEADFCCDSACPSEGLRVWSGTLPSQATDSAGPSPELASPPASPAALHTASPTFSPTSLQTALPLEVEETTTIAPTMDPMEVCSAACPELNQACALAPDPFCGPTPECELVLADALCCMLEERPVECAAWLAKLGAGLAHEQHVCMERLKVAGCSLRHGDSTTAETGVTTVAEIAAAVPGEPAGSALTTAFPTNWFVSSSSVTTAFPTNWFVSSSPVTTTEAPAKIAAVDIPHINVMPFDDCFDGICDNTEVNVMHLQTVSASSNAKCRGICLNTTSCDFSSFCPPADFDCELQGTAGSCALYRGCWKNSTTAWMANDAGWSSCPRLKETR